MRIKHKKESKVSKNEDIKAKKVRLVDADGKQLGIMEKEEAQTIALEKELDLVQVSVGIDPPVCKLVDYNRYRYQRIKKKKQNKKKQKNVQLKEIRIRPRIDKHDLEIKAKHIEKFLEEKDKVKISVVFRGRELKNVQAGREILERLKERFIQIATIEKDVCKDGRVFHMIVVPKK
ncbi:translation initiation factor IF-3 [bacterium]|nr:translation initiation factor IF-3 [bacterium]